MLQAERNITNHSKLLQNAFLKIVYRYGSCAVQVCRVCRCVTELYSRAYDLRVKGCESAASRESIPSRAKRCCS